MNRKREAGVDRLEGDPALFRALFPAEQADVIGRDSDGVRVSITMREPWPAGVVKWTEWVRRKDAGAIRVVHREAEPGGYYKTMVGTWQITPLPAGNAAVVYRVAMDIVRWAPKWMLRRGVTKGMTGTLARLICTSARVIWPGKAPATKGSSVMATVHLRSPPRV